MKRKLAAALLIVAVLLATGVVGVTQQPQQSIEEQIKQKEAELERLKEIKKRQDKIRELQEEVRRLQGGETVPTNEAPVTPTPQPEASPTAELESSPSTGDQPTVTAPTPLIAGNSASTSPVFTLRSCTTVEPLPSTASSLLERQLCRTKNAIERRKKGDPKTSPPQPPNPSAGMILSQDKLLVIYALMAREGRAQYILDFENDSVDTQVGSDASSSGSTSLVSKGSVPAILGFAVDNGGLLRSTNGSTITFRGNVTGLANLLSGKGFVSGYDEDSPAARFLRKTSFAFSFDTSRGDQPGVFTGNKQQISNYSVHVDLYNQRDPRAGRYVGDWKKFLSTSEALVKQIALSRTVLIDIPSDSWNDPALQEWYSQMNKAIKGAPLGQVEAVLLDQIPKIPTNLSDTTLTEVRALGQPFKEWIDGRQGILDKIAKAPIISFDYLNDRPLNAPSLSKFNLIGELGFGPRLDLTFNGALTMFNKKPTTPGTNRVRDFQFATQLDMPFGEIGLGMGKPVLSFAGRYERLMANATNSAGLTVPNTQGDIGVGQIKLVIPIKNSGVRIPFSFSFANRTELVKEQEVRGNFGFTFDLDTIFAKFKPF